MSKHILAHFGCKEQHGSTHANASQLANNTLEQKPGSSRSGTHTEKLVHVPCLQDCSVQGKVTCDVFKSLCQGVSVILEVVQVIFLPLQVVRGVLHMLSYDAHQPLIRWSEGFEPPLLLIKLGCLYQKPRLAL